MYRIKRLCAKWLVAGVVSALAPGTGTAACSIDDLAFMQGLWHSADGNSRGEERWVLTPAHTLAGSAWEAKGEALGFVEALMIVPQDGHLEMHLRHFDGSLNHAWEDRDAPMVFVLVRCEDGAAVFDGSGARSGEHITYRRTPAGLVFVGEFLHQGKPVHVEVDLTKSR